MKKCCIILVMLLFLTGCGARETMETVSDDFVQPVSATVRQVLVELPEEAAAPAMENETAGKLYLCDGYTVTLQTMEAGDLSRTLRSVTGFPKEELKLIETTRGEAKRYDCVWTAAGEGENQVCRVSILDDGSYHYVLTVMAGESQAGQLQQTFRDMFNSFRLVTEEPDTDA